MRPTVPKPTSDNLLLGVGAAAFGYGAYLYFSPRRRVLSAARGELGSTNWQKYLEGVAEPTGGYVIWCGIFALWALHKAGLGRDVLWRYNPPNGFLFRLPVTDDPQPGDIGYISTNQHHAIVESVDGDTITTIDGNSYGRKVARNARPRSAFAAFYSIQPMIDGEL